MSVCSNTLRAWSRSRVPASKTLLPFLYQTATIQQLSSVTIRPAIRRAFRSRSYADEEIPFADGALPSGADHEPGRETTITDVERKAFKKLYRTAARQGQARKDKSSAVKADEIADAYYADEDESVSLDRIFDEVFKGKPALEARASMQRKTPSRSQHSRKYPDSAIEEEKAAETESIAASKATAQRIKQLRTSEMERFTHLLQTARTDLELWQILDSEVFARVRVLDLDQPPAKNRAEAREEAQAKAATMTAQRVLFQNFPHYLVQAIEALRTNFPASPLPLSILPAIKSLGPSSYALGATTSLYKHLIRTAWIQLSSYPTIELLLDDMNNGAIEFDAEILALLDSIIKEHNMALSGVFGREMIMVHGMDLFVEGIDKIVQWRRVVAQRLEPSGPRNIASPLVGGVGIGMGLRAGGGPTARAA